MTSLAALPDKKKPEEAAPAPPQSAAQQKMEAAVTAQKDLLAEFAKVSDQLGDILASLEASTFVKRFKAASRQQMALASAISQKTLDSFGIEKAPAAVQPIAKTEKSQSEIVRIIQSDLDAYYERKQDTRFKPILDEMKKTEVVSALAGNGEKIAGNLSGQSIIGSEYWADTLDRWGEELVAASNCKGNSTCSGDSLPPEIVLEVMKVLRDEMKLRDETRETENARAANSPEKYASDAGRLAATQGEIGTHNQAALGEIRGPAGRRPKIPEGNPLAATGGRGHDRKPRHPAHSRDRPESHRR